MPTGLNFTSSGTYFTLCFDETTNKAGEKEFQVKIRYWSAKEMKIVSKHICTSYMRHATAEDLIKQINDAIDSVNLSKGHIVMLGSDGPNVNKKVARLLNDELKLSRGKGLIDIGTCNIHVMHNAFLKGLEELGSNCTDLCVALKYFFKDKPSRWDDFQKIQKELDIPTHHFIKHVSSRWLTLQDAATRIIDQWPAILKYFLDFVPKRCPLVEKTSTYKTIYSILKKTTIKSEILFVISSAGLFTGFTKPFQKEEPLIHILHEEIIILLTSLLLRCCKENVADIIKNSVSDDILRWISQQQNTLSTKNVKVDVAVSEELNKISEDQRMIFLHQAKKHYISCAKHIIEKCLRNQTLLKHFKVQNISKIKIA